MYKLADDGTWRDEKKKMTVGQVWWDDDGDASADGGDGGWKEFHNKFFNV